VKLTEAGLTFGSESEVAAAERPHVSKRKKSTRDYTTVIIHGGWGVFM